MGGLLPVANDLLNGLLKINGSQPQSITINKSNYNNNLSSGIYMSTDITDDITGSGLLLVLKNAKDSTTQIAIHIFISLYYAKAYYRFIYPSSQENVHSYWRSLAVTDTNLPALSL